MSKKGRWIFVSHLVGARGHRPTSPPLHATAPNPPENFCLIISHHGEMLKTYKGANKRFLFFPFKIKFNNMHQSICKRWDKAEWRMENEVLPPNWVPGSAPDIGISYPKNFNCTGKKIYKSDHSNLRID